MSLIKWTPRNTFLSPFVGESMLSDMDRFINSFFSGGFDMKDEPLSFSGSYWTARNYSINCGGEAIDHAVKMARWITELSDCPHQEIAEKILEKYGTIFDNHIPCVYAVKLPDKEIKVRDGLDELLEKNGVPGKTSAGDPLIKYDIPKESIVARIDLSKEIKRWRPKDTMKGPYPVPWD